MTETSLLADVVPTMRTAALEYATRGWPVFPLHVPITFGPKKGEGRAKCSCHDQNGPCTSQGKHPRLGAGGLHLATTDLAQVEAWWDQWPRANIGIRTGDVFDVVDLDSKVAVDTLESLGFDLDTGGPIVSTGNGRHIYITPTGSGNRVAIIPGLDLRGAGGYVVAPPSIHYGGGRYQWLTDANQPIPDREDLVDFIRSLDKPPPPPPPPSTPRPTVDGITRYTQVTLDRAIGRVEAAPEGERNHQLNASAYTLGRIVAGGELTRPQVEDELMAAAIAAGLGEKEAEATIASGLAAGLKDGPNRSHTDALAGPVNVDDYLPSAPKAEAPSVAPEAPDEEPWAGFGVWAPADLSVYLDGDWEPEPPTLFTRTDGRGLWYRANVNWLHGASGEGKTWIALLATAQELQAGRHVSWVHYEDPLPDKITNRLTLLGVPREAILNRFHVSCIGAESLLKGIPLLRAIIGHYGSDLVVIDSIGEAIGSDGIAVKEDERLVKWLHETCRVLAGDGNTVLAIDHLPMGEPGRLDPVGSYRKKAATTGAMFLAESPKPPTKSKPGYIKLTCAKDRSGLWTKGEVAAIVRIAPQDGGGIEWEVGIPQAEKDGEVVGEPLEIICGRHAVRIIAERGELSRTQLEAGMIGIKAKGTVKRLGIDFAAVQGWLEEYTGPRNARMYRIGPTELSTADDLLERWGKGS